MLYKIQVIFKIQYTYLSSNVLENSSKDWQGSIPISKMIFEMVNQKVKINLYDAIKRAHEKIGSGSHPISAALGVEKGFLVYHIFFLNSDNLISKVTLDAAMDQILALENDWKGGGGSFGGGGASGSW
jgi:uncharacterized membrane protein YgcG